MTLPRFTAGKVGTLSFEHLNEAFALIDQLRSQLVTDYPQQPRHGNTIITARITGRNADGLMKWKEVVCAEATSPSASNGARIRWVDRDGGSESGETDSEAFEPCIVPPRYASFSQTVHGLPLDTVVTIMRASRQDGRPLWIVMDTATLVFPGRINASQPIPNQGGGQADRWLYSWTEVERRFNSTLNEVAWTAVNGGRYGNFGSTDPGLGPAVNGAEVNGMVGRGGSGPTGQSVARNAQVLPGQVVTMSYAMDGTIYFSAGNTLAVSCT